MRYGIIEIPALDEREFRVLFLDFLICTRNDFLSILITIFPLLLSVKVDFTAQKTRETFKLDGF